ncbi:hypothetical protein [Synechococcus sp. MIT S1220]|uniref:hypothetical protein n=1 Tax=Synechococcus sp. MIT S1220 TaxID=3082549 RepID=UPI0039AEB66F
MSCDAPSFLLILPLRTMVRINGMGRDASKRVFAAFSLCGLSDDGTKQALFCRAFRGAGRSALLCSVD